MAAANSYGTTLTLKRIREALAASLADAYSFAASKGYVIIDDRGYVLSEKTAAFTTSIKDAMKVPEEFAPELVGGTKVVTAFDAASVLQAMLEAEKARVEAALGDIEASQQSLAKAKRASEAIKAAAVAAISDALQADLEAKAAAQRFDEHRRS